MTDMTIEKVGKDWQKVAESECSLQCKSNRSIFDIFISSSQVPTATEQAFFTDTLSNITNVAPSSIVYLRIPQSSNPTGNEKEDVVVMKTT